MAASVGTVYVDVRFNIGDIGRQLQAALAGVGGGLGGPGGPAAPLQRSFSQAFSAIGTQAQQTGRKLSVGLTLPLVALGKTAVSSFAKFDESMTRISALNQVPIEQTNEWRNEVRELGKTYGVAAEEAADALYFITSSGIEGAKSIEVLEVAIKGAAVGLGDTKVVADVVTSAMNAYGEANLSAAHAGDVLAEAVHLGKGEADELAGALSQVIPIAANVGVTFGEVSGAMAAMTLSGTSADQAATQLRGLFNTLQDMPPIAQKALKSMTGIEYGAVKLGLANEGLIPTLKVIFDEFEKLGPVGKQGLSEVFGNIRALTGIMNLFGQNSAQTLEIVEKVINANGTLDKAWEVTAQSKAKKLEIAMNGVHDAMIGLGEDAIPIVTGVANAVGGLANAFTALPGPVRSAAVAFGALAAAAGPAVWAFGGIASGIGSIGKVVNKVAPSLGRLASGLRVEYQWAQESNRATTGLIGKMGGLNQALGGAGIAVGTAIAMYTIWNARMSEATERAEALGKVLTSGPEKGGGFSAADKSIENTRKQIESLNKEASASNLSRWNPLDLDYFGELGKYIDELEKGIQVVEQRKTLAGQMAAATGGEKDAILDWLAAQYRAGKTYPTAEAALKALAESYLTGDEATKKLAKSTVQASNSLGGMISRAKETADMFFAVTDAEEKQADALENLQEAKDKVTDAEEAYAEAGLKTLEADRKVADAQRKSAEATRDLTKARQGLTDAQNELNKALQGPSEDEQLDVRSAELSVKEAEQNLREIGRGKGKKDPLERERAEIALARARIDLENTRGEHDQRVAELREGVASAQDSVNAAVQAQMDAQEGVLQAQRDRTQAGKDEAKAFDDIGKAQLGVRDAEKDLADSTANLMTKQEELNDQLALGTLNGAAFMTFLEALKTKQPETAGVIDEYIRKFKELNDAQAGKNTPEPEKPKPTMPAPQYDPSLNLNPLQRFFGSAHGNPLSAGQVSRVNELGKPELWSANGRQYLLPLTDGRVTPLQPIDVPVRGHDGGVNTGDINIYEVHDPRQAAIETRRELRKQAFLAGGR